jgi:hypothetical protein
VKQVVNNQLSQMSGSKDQSIEEYESLFKSHSTVEQPKQKAKKSKKMSQKKSEQEPLVDADPTSRSIRDQEDESPKREKKQK